jgi:class 3 adenylate cyclase/tetratricopeptide (TPR) repeat protein
MSERLARHGNVGAEEVTDVINSTFAELLSEAYQHGSHLLKFGGDAMLLMLGEPGHAGRATAAAAGMRSKLRELGAFQTTAGKVALRMSIGAHSGPIDFFLVGSSHRELIVAGPTASGTVEMESTARAGQILISPATAALLPDGVVGVASGPGYLLRRAPDTTAVPFRPAESPDVDLTQFIPRALRATLMEDRVESEHRPASIAFIQYQGFDALLNARGGDKAASVLNHLVTTVQEAADTHAVTFLGTDIAGDGGKIILATGVPEATGNDNERMLLALRQIVDRTSDELPVRIGVNRGPVFAGEVGPPYRRSYTVMGDTVNLAARLMAAAPRGEIYAAQEVLGDSRTMFAITTPARFRVKGKREEIQAFSVGNPEGTREGAGDTLIPLVGRDAELEGMLDAWAHAKSGRGHAIEVVGDVGLGKTRLVDELVARADLAHLVRTECRLYQASTPYFPLRELLAQVCGLESSDYDDNRHALTDIVTQRIPELEPWLALLGEVAGIELAESTEVADLESQFRPARTLFAVGKLLEALVTEPTIFIVENGHWMDPSSRQLLGGLVALMERLPWLFVVASRPTEEDSLSGQHPWSRGIELGPLTEEASKTLINEASASSPLLPYQVDQLTTRGEGRPMFLLELLEALQRGGDVEKLPSSVEGLVRARIDQLPGADRHLLRRLSVLGAGFLLEHTTAVLTEREQDRRRQILAIRRLRDFLTLQDGGWVSFSNALIRDVAYAGLPYKTRVELHARVGESIRASAGASPDAQAALLSLHYFQARNWEDAWRFSRVAGDSAKAVYANQTAATFYQRALASARHVDLSLDERADVAEALGDVLQQSGRYDEALDAYRRAMAEAGDDTVRRAGIMLKRAGVKMNKGSYVPALRDTTEGIKLVGDRTSAEARQAEARLLSLRAYLRQAQQRPGEALTLAEETVAAARASGEQTALARALTIMDWAYFSMGEPAKATHMEQAAEIYESLGLLERAADVANNMGAAAWYLGEWDQSLSRYQQAQAMYLKAGNDWKAASTGANIGELLVSQGKLDEAEPILEESLRVLHATNNRDYAINAELYMALLVAERGDQDRACDMFTVIRDEAVEIGRAQSALEASLYRAKARIEQGEAMEALDEIIKAAQQAGEDAVYLSAKRSWVTAKALVALDRFEEAADEIASGLESARELGVLYDEALLLIDQLSVREKLGHIADPAEIEQTNRLLSKLGLEQMVGTV